MQCPRSSLRSLSPPFRVTRGTRPLIHAETGTEQHSRSHPVPRLIHTIPSAPSPRPLILAEAAGSAPEEVMTQPLRTALRQSSGKGGRGEGWCEAGLTSLACSPPSIRQLSIFSSSCFEGGKTPKVKRKEKEREKKKRRKGGRDEREEKNKRTPNERTDPANRQRQRKTNPQPPQ